MYVFGKRCAGFTALWASEGSSFPKFLPRLADAQTQSAALVSALRSFSVSVLIGPSLPCNLEREYVEVLVAAAKSITTFSSSLACS